jgi:hypothetical protein
MISVWPFYYFIYIKRIFIYNTIKGSYLNKIDLVEDTGQWMALLNTVMNLGF